MILIQSKKFLLWVVVLLIWLFLPAAAFADGNITVTVSDPDTQAGEKLEGNTVNSILFKPTVTYGDNRIMGTLRITGKEGISMPLTPGQKIMVSFPPGLCYMSTPTSENYKNYVEWPQSVDGLKNQIQDVDNKAGVKFVAGTPRSITVEINNVDSVGKIMVLDFVFNKENYSTTRVSQLLDVNNEFKDDPDGKVTRLEFFEKLADITVPFPSCPLKLKDSDRTIPERFSDLGNVEQSEINKIKPLIDAEVIVGYQNLLEPNSFITRAQAAHAIGKLFPEENQKPAFKDDLPGWATGINAASAKGIIIGYPDGTFRPDQYITKSEVLILLQKTLESYGK